MQLVNPFVALKLFYCKTIVILEPKSQFSCFCFLIPLPKVRMQARVLVGREGKHDADQKLQALWDNTNRESRTKDSNHSLETAHPDSR